jgi:hypothetical protein
MQALQCVENFLQATELRLKILLSRLWAEMNAVYVLGNIGSFRSQFCTTCLIVHVFSASEQYSDIGRGKWLTENCAQTVKRHERKGTRGSREDWRHDILACMAWQLIWAILLSGMM